MPVARALASGAGEGGQLSGSGCWSEEEPLPEELLGLGGPPSPPIPAQEQGVPSQQSQRTVILSVFAPEAPGSHTAHRQ